jgi:copper resistance protein D
MVDLLSITVRALSFVLVFQAVGTALFLAGFGRLATWAHSGICRLGWAAAVAGAVAVASHQALEAGRMAGELAGVLDPSLQGMAMNSPAGAAFVLRIVGLVLVGVGLARGAAAGVEKGWFGIGLAVAGAVLALVSFAVVGHTASSAYRWLLAPLLLIHLLISAFWFGSLWPLYWVSRHEPPVAAGRIIDAFSAAAVWLVPLILVVGLGMALLLLPDATALGRPYGELLLTKIALFALLLVLAAVNKWRLGPAIARGDPRAPSGFRKSVLAEYCLICCVLAVTATMTSLFSPE